MSVNPAKRPVARLPEWIWRGLARGWSSARWYLEFRRHESHGDGRAYTDLDLALEDLQRAKTFLTRFQEQKEPDRSW